MKHLEMSTTTTTTRSSIKILILIFFKVISSREVVPNFNEDEIVLALNEDNTGLQHYAMGFWKPLPKERPFQKRFYLIQSSAQTESPLVKKQPEIFENLIGKIAQKSDFINLPNTVGDVMTQLFETQDQILTTSKFSNDTYGELSVNKAVIDLHLKTPLSLPRNAQLFPENREMVGGFIFKALAKSGLMLVSEEFKYQRVTVDPEKIHTMPFEVGNNIVGLIPGKHYNTSNDRIVLIGAHWDTFGVSPGLNDNGSGVASLLEIARILASAQCFKPDFSVMFVVFDAEESGCKGSQEFIASHLKPHLKITGGSIQGAYILDTLLNYDSRPGSQHYSKAWKLLADKNIKSNEQREHRGDFVATVTRQDPSDLKLREILAKYLASTLNEEKYHHEAVTVNSLTHDQLPTLKDIVDASHFWMSDHSRFWYHLEQGSDMFNAGAVLVTDTAYLRGHMEQCFHRKCDNIASLREPENSLEFLSEITQALVLSIFELTMPKGSTCSISSDDQNEFNLLDEKPKDILKEDHYNKTFVNDESENEFDETINEIPDDDFAPKNDLEMLENTNQKIHMKNYQPHFKGTQINIENLNIINDESQVKMFLEKFLKRRRASPMVLSVKNAGEL